MSQSRKVSLLEAATNVAVGYGLAIVTQMIVFPWFGIEAGLEDHLALGLAFLIVSLLRAYVLRRLFDRIAVGGLSRHDPRDDSTR